MTDLSRKADSQQEPDPALRLADWERVRAAIAAQPMLEPPAHVHNQVLARIRQPQRSSLRLSAPVYASAAGLALVIMALLWMIIQPGVVLAWQAGEAVATAYRVYRAPLEGGEFELVAEISAGEAAAYSYVDLFLFPWQAYNYVVEGLGANGQMMTSQAVTGRAMDALPGQLALVSASLLAGLGIVLLFQYMLEIRKKFQQNPHIFPGFLS